MSKRQLRIGACVIALLLALPRTGSAGLAELILEMSGPQMLGFPVECRVGLSHGASLEFCHGLFWTFAGTGPDTTTKLWLTLEGGPYFSTGVGKHSDLYEKGDVWMFNFDPLIEGISLGTAKKGFYHGAGFTTNFLVGEKFKRFGNAGFKIRPIGAVFPAGGRVTADIAFNLRIYPDRFTAEDFEVPGPPEEGVEWVKSITFVLRF